MGLHRLGDDGLVDPRGAVKEILAGNDLKMANGYPERVREAMALEAVGRKDLETCARRVLELILKID